MSKYLLPVILILLILGGMSPLPAQSPDSRHIMPGQRQGQGLGQSQAQSPGQGQGRRYGHRRYPEGTDPNLYELNLPPDLEGRTWNASNLAGKVVVLNFWATWCAPCLNQIPDVKKLYEGSSREELIILGVNLDTGGNRSLRRWLRLNRQNVTWPQLFNRGGFNSALSRAFTIKDVPSILIFDQQGELAFRCNSASCTKSAVQILLEKD